MNRRKSNSMQQVRDRAIHSLNTCIGKYYRRTQQRWADWMDKKFNKLSIAKQKRVFIISAFTSSVFLTLACLQPLDFGWKYTSQKSKPPAPNHHLNTQPDTLIALSIEEFQKHVDSLCKSDQGREEFNQLMKQRPGLFDSIEMVKKMYNIK